MARSQNTLCRTRRRFSNRSYSRFWCFCFSLEVQQPELANSYKVYATDLLGFGRSDKAIIEYDAMVWRDQVVDFLKEKVKEPAILVGNSLGGFTALIAAVGLPEQVAGVALLNSSGQFGNPNAEASQPEETDLQKFFLKQLKDSINSVYATKLLQFLSLFVFLMSSSLFSQINDAIHVESEQVHSRQRLKQTFLPTVVALG